MVILEAKQIVKVYGDFEGEGATTAVNGMDLSIRKGEFVAIMGPSGSGKTTLLHILSGIDSKSSGTVTIAGTNLSEMKDHEIASFRRRKLGFVFQDFNLLDSLTVKENILLPMVLEKKKAAEMDERVNHLANLFNIADILEKYPYQISGGQQQRTAVSRALANEPSILFADEPTGNLDSKASSVMMECFEKIVSELSTTVLLVTHDVFSASYCHKVIFIKDGMIHSDIVRKGNRREFLHQIMDHLAVIGGRTDVL
jgi:putative ABC transport system ATP-binding protein